MRGSSLCGAVVFAVLPPLRDVVVCLCRQCRKGSGHFRAASSVPLDRFDLLKDEGLTWFRSSDTARRGFYGICGSTLFWQPDDGARISFSPGVLDEHTGPQTARHILVADQGDHSALNDGVPQHPAKR